MGSSSIDWSNYLQDGVTQWTVDWWKRIYSTYPLTSVTLIGNDVGEDFDITTDDINNDDNYMDITLNILDIQINRTRNINQNDNKINEFIKKLIIQRHTLQIKLY